ncbi:MAG: DUF2088 domain-containing protein [Chloroflexi bacterium]|nr:DUF2088 domain-containing protein [Chloroflexota bacterium]
MTSRLTPSRSLDNITLYHIRQRWQSVALEPERVVEERFTAFASRLALTEGSKIAITAGSRGITSMPEVLRAIVRVLRARAWQPFIFPAMGSHGGGTAEGQRGMLAELGITLESVGAPIVSSMEVVPLGSTPLGTPVYLDAAAAQADGIIVVNRIKKHTNLDAAIESGLVKMLAVGMGKHRGAAAIHRLNTSEMGDELVPCAQLVLATGKVLAGVALIEGPTNQLAELEVLAPDEIITREPVLLARAKTLTAGLPFSQCDILIVERMGKEISGTGMDCHVIGRRRIIGEPEWQDAPDIHSLVLLRLTPASHGNAVGVGLADFTTRELAQAIDWEITRANVLTSGNLERAKLPLVFESDRAALEAAGFRERGVPAEALKLAVIRDTLHLQELLVSQPLLEQLNVPCEVLAGPLPLRFDANGRWSFIWKD